MDIDYKHGMPLKGHFVLKNPQKYIGKNRDNIIFRSSWEYSVMLSLDSGHPGILAWMSESIPSNHVHSGISGIPYKNPFTGRQTIYVPDFYVIYMQPNNRKFSEVIEIKPLDEVPPRMSGVNLKVDQLKQAKQILNAAKYEAAIKFCSQRGWYFRLMTEKNLFAFGRPQR